MRLRRLLCGRAGGPFVLALATSFAFAAEPLDFNKQVKPILELHCLKCHGGEKPKGRLSLETREAALKGGDDGSALVPGKPQESPLYTTTALPPDHDDVMPPAKEPPMKKSDIEILRAWVEQGAPWPADVKLAGVRRMDFVKDVQPILEFNCVRCHREGEPKGGLRLDSKQPAFSGGANGPGIVPGKPLQSTVFITMALATNQSLLMPPLGQGGPLTNDETRVISAWIEQGANWPEGTNLIARKKEEAPGGNEPLTVAQIHELILAHLEAKTEAEMKTYTNTIPGTQVTYSMAPIRGGEFVMGSPESEQGSQPDERPPHKVKVLPFWMGVCEVTWNEYELFMYPDEERKFKTEFKTDPAIDTISDAVARPTKPYVEMSFGMGKESYPAISMTQHAANKYCQWLSAKTGHYYRLPTEAEWEYACRAGTTTRFSFGDDESQIGEYAWFEQNSDFKYQKVGRKKPNPWGLYDMHGNIAEWCLDGYEPNAYEQFAGALAANPWVKAAKPYPHVARGGSWNDVPEKLRSAARLFSDKSWKQQDPQLPKSIWYHTDAQFLGFRVVRPLEVPSPEELEKVWNSGVEKE